MVYLMRFKMIRNNAVMVGLTVSMHFQQFDDLKFQNFSGRGSMLPDPRKSLCL